MVIAIAVDRSCVEAMLCVHCVAGEGPGDVGEHLGRGSAVVL